LRIVQVENCAVDAGRAGDSLTGFASINNMGGLAILAWNSTQAEDAVRYKVAAAGVNGIHVVHGELVAGDILGSRNAITDVTRLDSVFAVTGSTSHSGLGDKSAESNGNNLREHA